MNNQPLQKKERLYSLDVLRGLDMLLLTVIGPLIQAAQASWKCFPLGFMKQFGHGWECFTLWDIIMPLFIFMCGAAIPFALGRRLEEGKGVFWKHVIWRVVMLWFLGGCVQGNWAALNPHTFSPFANTLQSIAVGYLAVAVVMSFRNKLAMIVVPILCAALYTVLLIYGGDYGKFSNFAFKVDQSIFKSFLPMDNSYIANPSFYTWFATSLMFAAMSFAGYHATKIVTCKCWSEWKRAGALFAYGASLLAVGFASEIWIPCIKPIFTLTFTAQAMGWCVIALGVCFVIHDIWKFRSGLGLVLLFGQFALCAYFVRGFFRKALEALTHACFDGVLSYLSQPMAGFCFAIASTVVLIVILLGWRKIKGAK